MTWKVEYLASAAKSFRKIDPQQRRRIRVYLEERVVSLDHPRQLGKPLRGELTKMRGMPRTFSAGKDSAGAAGAL